MAKDATSCDLRLLSDDFAFRGQRMMADGETPNPAPGEGGGIDSGRHLLRGVVWVGSLRWAGQAVSWGATLVVLRLLEPADYGLLGMAMVFVNLAQVFADFGIGSTVIAMQVLSSEVEEELHTTSVLMGLAALLLTLLAAYPLSLFYRQERLVPIVAALGVPLLLNGAASVPLARLGKALDYPAMAIADLLRSVFGALASLGLAVAGLGVWALVGGQLVGAVAGSSFVLSRSRVRLRRPHFDRLGPTLAYSRDTMLSRVGWMFYSGMPSLIGGRLLGPGPLGEFTFAWTLASMPGEKLVNVLNGVAVPVLARQQSNKARLGSLLGRLVEGIAFLTWPLLAGMALVSPLFVKVVFGSKWEGAIGPLAILAIYSMAVAVASPFAQVLLVTGATRVNRQLSLLGALVLPVAFWVGATAWGANGLAAAWLVAVPLLAVPSLVVLRRRIGFGFGEFFSAVRPAGIATVAMSIAVLAVQAVVRGPDVLRLGVAIGAGALTFAGVSWGLRGKHLSQLVSTIRRPVSDDAVVP